MLDDQRAKANPGPSCNLLPHHWVYAVQLPFFATIKKPSAISSWRLLDVKLPPASGCSHPAEAIVAVNPRGMDTLQLVSLPHHRGKRAHLPVFSNCRAFTCNMVFAIWQTPRLCARSASGQIFATVERRDPLRFYSSNGQFLLFCAPQEILYLRPDCALNFTESNGFRSAYTIKNEGKMRFIGRAFEKSGPASLP